MANYICDVCREKIATKQSQPKFYQRVSSLESSFTCSECSQIFSMAFEVTNRGEQECDENSETVNISSCHFTETAITCQQQSQLKNNCDAIDSNFDHVSKVNTSAIESQKVLPYKRVKYSETLNDYHVVADEKSQSYEDTLSCTCSINSSCECVDSALKSQPVNQHENDHQHENDQHENYHQHDLSHQSEEGSETCIGNHNKMNDLRYEMCNDNFNYKSRIEQHTTYHVDSKSFECNICHLTYKKKRALNYHMNEHSEINPFICKICKKCCTTQKKLSFHMLEHSGERPHKCNICSSTFKLKHVLTRHMVTHSEKRPHICNICHLSFKMKYNLIKHNCTHSEKRPYKCKFCFSIFKFKKYLNLHMYKHSYLPLFKCNICYYSTFKYQSGLTRHLKKYHQQNSEC